MTTNRSKFALTACGVAALTMGLSGCGAAFEGTGNKDAASAEQLALTAEDPWDAEINANTSASPNGKLVDGVYVGTGRGMAGLITTTIMVEDSKITCLAVHQDGETHSVGGFEAIRDGVYAEMIDAAQGSEFDTISGATITSAGVRQAVDDAIAKAQAGDTSAPSVVAKGAGDE